MKRIGKKGFMLLETLIVATFIMTIFSFIYKNGIPLIAEYTRRYHYDDINSVYAVHLMRNLLLSDGNFSSLTAGILEGETTYRDITSCDLWEKKDVCNALKTQLNITNSPTNASLDGKIYVTRYELSKLKQDIDNGLIFNGPNDRGIKTYLTYLPKYTTSKVTSGYRLVIVRNLVLSETEEVRYASIEVVKP